MPRGFALCMMSTRGPVGPPPSSSASRTVRPNSTNDAQFSPHFDLAASTRISSDRRRRRGYVDRCRLRLSSNRRRQCCAGTRSARIPGAPSYAPSTPCGHRTLGGSGRRTRPGGRSIDCVPTGVEGHRDTGPGPSGRILPTGPPQTTDR